MQLGQRGMRQSSKMIEKVTVLAEVGDVKIGVVDTGEFLVIHEQEVYL